MDRRGNYFMANDGQLGFNPLHILGLSGVHSKAMQHSFLGVHDNTHSMESDFSLFHCKDQDTTIVSLNNLLSANDTGLPVANGFSKLIGGFIGSKCLTGVTANRETHFWGKVLQQYTNIVASNSQPHLKMSANNAKENTGEYLKASAIDAALLISHSIDFFSRNNFTHQKVMGTRNVKLSEKPLESVSGTQLQEVSTAPKQSYAEVTKSLSLTKCHNSPPSVAHNPNSGRERSVRKNSKYREKDRNSNHRLEDMQASCTKNWRNRNDECDRVKHVMHGARCDKEPHRQRLHSRRDIQPDCASTRTNISHIIPVGRRPDLMRRRELQLSGANRKPTGRRKVNSSLLTDIKEDCRHMAYELMGNQSNKIHSNNHRFNHTGNTDLFTSSDRSVRSSCQNWRCRPHQSLCTPCKTKVYRDAATEHFVPGTKDCTLTCDLNNIENNMKVNFPEAPITREAEPEVTTCDSTVCFDSSVPETDKFIAAGCAIVRARIPSECSVDSEDSFIIMFDANSDDSDEENCSETDITDGDSSDDVDDNSNISSLCSILTDEEDDDEIDSECVAYLSHLSNDSIEIENNEYISENKLKEANARWQNTHENIPSTEKEPKKVQFAKLPELTEVHHIVAWDYAYRAARSGPWEQLARDRVRFCSRIEHMNEILGPVLADDHRSGVWQKLHADGRDVT